MNAINYKYILEVHLLPGTPAKSSVKGKTTKSQGNPVNIKEQQSTTGKVEKTRATFQKTQVKRKEEPNDQKKKVTLQPAQVEKIGL